MTQTFYLLEDDNVISSSDETDSSSDENFSFDLLKTSRYDLTFMVVLISILYIADILDALAQDIV